MIISEPIGDGSLIKLYSDQQVMIKNEDNGMVYEEVILPADADVNKYYETEIPNIDVNEHPKVQLLLNTVLDNTLDVYNLRQQNKFLEEQNNMLTECVLELSELLYE